MKEKQMGRPLRKDIFGTEVLGTYVSATGIRCEAYMSGSNQTDVYIVKQKAATRYLVADSSAVQDEDVAVGSAYIITVKDTTDWKSMGSHSNDVGTVFTCTTVCASPANGVANLVTYAKLVSGTPAANGEMRIRGLVNGATGSPVALKKIGKRIAVDFNGNRYKWYLQNDSTNDYIVLTQI